MTAAAIPTARAAVATSAFVVLLIVLLGIPELLMLPALVRISCIIITLSRTIYNCYGFVFILSLSDNFALSGYRFLINVYGTILEFNAIKTGIILQRLWN